MISRDDHEEARSADPKPSLQRHFYMANYLSLLHNHQSGVAEPSRADEHLTQTLMTALALIDVRVFDHHVIGRDEVISFAERGLIVLA